MSNKIESMLLSCGLSVPRDSAYSIKFDDDSGCYEIGTNIGPLLVSVRYPEEIVTMSFLKKSVFKFMKLYDSGDKFSCESLDEVFGYQGVKVISESRILVVRAILGASRERWAIISWEGDKNIEVSEIVGRISRVGIP